MQTNKQITRGFLLGKFMPLHNGHCHLIQTAINTCDEVTVLVCSLPTEPIDGKLRYKWVKERFPTANVIHYDKVVPQEPSEHPDFWNIWTKIIKDAHPEPIDFVFSSEDYGYKLAEVVGAKHVLVDKERITFPVSGTKVRNNPFLMWDYLPDNVKPYFVKRVLIHGGESCGKSTLTRLLAHHFSTIGIQEYAREWIENNNNEFEYEDLTIFAVKQTELIEEATLSANKLLFADTDAMTTKIYSEEYYNKVSPVVNALANLASWDLVLLLKPTIPHEAEIQRNFADKREYMHERFKQILVDLNLPFIEIDEVGPKRFEQAISIVQTTFQLEETTHEHSN